MTFASVARKHGRPALLAVVLFALAGTGTTAFFWQVFGVVPSSSFSAPVVVNNGVARAATTDVRLDALGVPRPEPISGARNPFRFHSAAAAAAPSPAPAAAVPVPVAPTPPETAVPAGPPPIPLRFIGIVSPSANGTKIAVLSDGRAVFYGREKEIVNGRFRIVQIGADSIDLSFVDGRGMQTIAFSGQ